MSSLFDNDDHYKNRWYDSYPKLMKLINKLKGSEKSKRETLILGMKEIIIEHDSELIDKHVQEFPMTYKRRWYDEDPDSWLVINSLKYADDDLLTDIILYLRERL